MKIKNVLENKSLKGIEIISGFKGINNIVKYVDVIEMPETIHLWFKKGMLMITSFNTVRDNEQIQINIIRELANAKGAGLILYPEFYEHHSLDNIKKISNKLNLPIMLLPDRFGSAEVIKIIFKEIFIHEIHSNKEKNVENIFKEIINKKDFPINKIKDKINSLEIDLSLYKVVLLIKLKNITSNDNNIIFNVIAFLKLNYKIIAFIEDDHIVIIPNENDINLEKYLKQNLKIVAQILIKKLKSKFENVSFYVGIGSRYDDIKKLNNSYIEAKKSIQICYNTDKSIIEYEDLAIINMLLNINNNEIAENYYMKYLSKIEKYDKKNNTNLLKTIIEYFNCEENLLETSKKLYVHVNTIKYRLNRIQEISNFDNFTIENKYKIYSALKLKGLIK